MSADKKWNEKKEVVILSSTTHFSENNINLKRHWYLLPALVNAGFRGVIFVFYLIFKKAIGG